MLKVVEQAGAARRHRGNACVCLGQLVTERQAGVNQFCSLLPWGGVLTVDLE